MKQIPVHEPERPRRRQVLECASPLALCDSLDASESGRGLPHSKTLARHPALSRFMAVTGFAL